MTSKSIFKTASAGLELVSGLGGDSFDLSGAYRFRATGATVEIEMMDLRTFRRNVVYVRPDSDLMVFLPTGAYKFRLNALVDNAKFRVIVTRMGALQKLSGFVGKAFHLLRRPPHESVAAFKSFLQRGQMNLPVAMQISGAKRENSPLKFEREKIEPAAPNHVRKSVSIIIPTKERVDLLRDCISSLSMIVDCEFEIVIVDNGATRTDMVAYLEELARSGIAHVLRRDIPFNFSKLCNDGAGVAKNPVLLFLNDDIEALDGEWLKAMLNFLAREDAGVIGARLLYPSGDLQHAGIATNLVPGPGHPWRASPRHVWETHPLLAQSGEVDAVTGACLMIKRDLFDRVGGFNETDFAITLNDVDLCLRVREVGLRIFYVAEATLLHKEGQSRKADDTPAESERYGRELAAFFLRHEVAAEQSLYYPKTLRRDSDSGAEI